MADKNELIEQIVGRYDREIGMLIPMMQDLQAECGYLPAEHLHCLGRRLNVPLSRLYADTGTAPVSVEEALRASDLFARYYHHAAPFHPEALHGPWRRCARTDPRCAAQIDAVLAMGLAPPRLSQR